MSRWEICQYGTQHIYMHPNVLCASTLTIVECGCNCRNTSRLDIVEYECVHLTVKTQLDGNVGSLGTTSGTLQTCDIRILRRICGHDRVAPRIVHVDCRIVFRRLAECLLPHWCHRCVDDIARPYPSCLSVC